MCKYEMDPMSIVEDTDGQTDRRTNGQTDKVKPVYPPFNFVEAGGITSLSWSKVKTTVKLRAEHREKMARYNMHDFFLHEILCIKKKMNHNIIAF